MKREKDGGCVCTERGIKGSVHKVSSVSLLSSLCAQTLWRSVGEEEKRSNIFSGFVMYGSNPVKCVKLSYILKWEMTENGIDLQCTCERIINTHHSSIQREAYTENLWHSHVCGFTISGLTSSGSCTNFAHVKTVVQNDHRSLSF